MSRIIILIFILICSVGSVFSDEFVPDFDAMKVLRCEFEETISNQDGSVVAKNDLFRIYSLEDEYNRLYLRREPIADVTYYGADKIEFKSQSMTDDYIMLSTTIINRQSGEYISNGQMTYDNPIFGVRNSKSIGTCRALN